MSHPERMRRIGGLAVSAVAVAPFVYLWIGMMRDADDPLTFRARLDMAIWIAVFGTPWMIAARLLWRTWWRRAGARLSTLDGPARVFALTFVGLLGGLATLTRRARPGSAGPGPARRSPGWRWPASPAAWP